MVRRSDVLLSYYFLFIIFSEIGPQLVCQFRAPNTLQDVFQSIFKRCKISCLFLKCVYMPHSSTVRKSDNVRHLLISLPDRNPRCAACGAGSVTQTDRCKGQQMLIGQSYQIWNARTAPSRPCPVRDLYSIRIRISTVDTPQNVALVFLERDG